MSKHDEHKGCAEFHHLSRRKFLGLSAGALAAAAVPAWLPKIAFAASGGSRDVLVSIFLRGGADGLTLVVPHGEDAYYDLRPTLAIPRPGDGPHSAIDLDGFFGLPRAMVALKEAYDDGALLLVHATGLPDPTRSHFSAMYFMEVGRPSPPSSLFTGWLGRHLATTPAALAGAPLRAIGLGYGLPRSLVGGPQTVPVRDLSDVGLAGDEALAPGRRRALDAMYAAATDSLLKASASNTTRTIDLLQRIDFSGYHPAGGAEYPDDEFGNAIKSTAALIKAQVGVEAATIDLGGWDSHEEMGAIDGDLAVLMTSLSRGLAAFHKDLFTSGFDRVVVTVQSEFGRNASENASRGADHGHGGAMIVLGGQVAGGRVLADWPGLAPEQLYEEQDLQITIDYRDVLAEILEKRLGNTDLAAVFPDPSYTPSFKGVIR
ncbi:MAG TPA: DUF1501 domain-containing protein [Thermoanaerobaculia bacterium]|jgi:uncharacterized protein (DUF1501 family)|nr:DUF1501 domain-containing protein [Thermoanaerobaculia bacterium]